MVNHADRFDLKKLCPLPMDARDLDSYFPSGVYILLREGQVVYVGQSVDVYGRLRNHRHDCTGDFDSFTWMQLPEPSLNYYEALAIVTFRPALNTTIPSNDRFMPFKRMRRVLWHEWDGFTLKPHHVAHIPPVFVDSSNRSTNGLEFWDLWQVQANLQSLQGVG